MLILAISTVFYLADQLSAQGGLMSGSLLNRTNFISGIICALFYFISRVICGNGLDMVHKLSGFEILPPMWIFNAIFLVFYFIIGIAIGGMIHGISLRQIRGEEEICAYKGGLFFISSFFLGITWFPIFFVFQSLFFSVLCALSALMCALVCAFHWYKTANKISPTLMATFSVWMFYIMFLSLSAAIRF